ncbi:hypothetical protein [Massilia sp. GCM10023247]|uniref:hypothetical protein n=1 Tax=Massilia sp. GCM10023247 TaxID=3252643 RepID=UPI00361DE9CA
MSAINPIVGYFIIFCVGEIFAFVVFPILRKTIIGAPVVKKPDIETFKGILERLVIFIGLASDYSTVLVMFGALKLGTRLSEEGNKNISNNYFLIGNFVSVLIAIAATVVAKHLVT